MNLGNSNRYGITGRRHFKSMLVAIFIAALLGGCRERPAVQQTNTQAPAQNATPTLGFTKDSGKLQVGFITVGPVSDFGYNYQHNQGRLALEAKMRDKVHTVLVENIPETAEVERVMQRMVDEGANVIFATSYGYLDSALRVAQRNPKVTFMHCLGAKNAPNLGTYSASLWEPAYVAGVVTAMTAKNPRFGFVTSHPIPPVFWILNAFTLGAQSVNKNVTVDVVYTNSWNNPSAETEAVKSLADKGVGAVYVLVDSPIAGVQAAERAGIYSVAQHADLSSFAPKGWITGSVWGWGKVYEDVVGSVLNHTWTNQPISGGFKEGYVSVAPFGPAVPAAAQQKSHELIRKIASGEISVFQGPIADSEGKERVARGKSMTVPEILSFDWVVKGVRGGPAH
ncbi:MAG: basic rane protein [Acidobacteriota bacterium]|jgi:basic membrane lipoprotein Med (substrate-binding protein (PBP1-ABC) superfamily)|nr:basic rane protein [Acidobacteriota bacterium]